MNDTSKLSQQLYDTALDELNTYLEDLKTKPPQEDVYKRQMMRRSVTVTL